ncbi:MAG: hypothetical protein HEEMFOPI_01993 [Holosporales bacterium]
MKILFLLFISHFLYCSQHVQSREDPLLLFTHQESTENLSFLVQDDAKDFINQFSPFFGSPDITNPYEVFFSYILFSETFKIYNNVSRRKFEKALFEISNNKNISYYRVFFQSFSPSSSHPFNSRAIHEFKNKHRVILKKNEENVFVQFMLGFLEYIEGVDSNDESKIETGKNILKISAHRFCLPAAKIFYKDDQKILDSFNDISNVTIREKSESIHKIIQLFQQEKHNMFLENELYRDFENRLLSISSPQEKRFFTEVEKKLTDRMLQHYRSVYFTLLNKKYVFLLSSSALSIIIASFVNYAISGQSYLPYMIIGGFFGFSTSLFLLLNNPSFVNYKKDFLDMERSLCALYLMYSHFLMGNRDPSSLADSFYTFGPYSYSLRKYFLHQLFCKENETFSQLFIKEARK